MKIPRGLLITALLCLTLLTLPSGALSARWWRRWFPRGEWSSRRRWSSRQVSSPSPYCGSNCRAKFFKDQIFTPVSAFSDEFSCRRRRCRNLGSKWIRNDPKRGTGGTNWAGREPLLFVAENIYKKKDHLTIEARSLRKNSRAWKRTFDVKPPGRSITFADAGYMTYTGGFVQATAAVKHGYFESRHKPTKLELVSSFWMSRNTPTKWSEIDVAELCHVSGDVQKFGMDFRQLVSGNAHVFRDQANGLDPNGKTFTAGSRRYKHNRVLADTFNNYAVFWSEDRIEWFFNGKPFGMMIDEFGYFDQELNPKWTVEANLGWHGVLPDPEQMRRTKRSEARRGVVHGSTEMSISHIRAWSTKLKEGSSTTRLLSLLSRRRRRRNDRVSMNDFVQETRPRINTRPTEKKEPFEVLQRAPYGNEKLLEPVRPPAGETWETEIKKAMERRRRRRRR